MRAGASRQGWWNCCRRGRCRSRRRKRGQGWGRRSQRQV